MFVHSSSRFQKLSSRDIDNLTYKEARQIANYARTLINKRIDYLCSLKKQKFTISMNFLLLSSKLPCHCIKRSDVSLDRLQNEIENWEKEEKKICSKHNSSFLCYCFECELMLCVNCINKFHNEYFHNHHLYYKDNL